MFPINDLAYYFKLTIYFRIADNLTFNLNYKSDIAALFYCYNKVILCFYI